MRIRLPSSVAPPESDGVLVRHFVNRDSERDTLVSLLATPMGKVIPLTVFYGERGSGKSFLGARLLAELRGELPEELAPWLTADPSVAAMRLDLSREVLLHEPIRVLQELRNGLSVECPRFDLALAWLHRKQETGTGSGLWRTEAEALAAEAVGTLEGASLDELPGAQPAHFATTWLASQLRGTKLGEWLHTRDGCEDFLALRERALPAFTYRLLLERLADDLHQGLPKPPERACRLVILLDAFEHISELGRGKRDLYRSEVWVRELYECLGAFALIVILSQKKLSWAERDSDWAKPAVCQQKLLAGLALPDAEAILCQAGIESAEHKSQLLAASRDSGKTYSPRALGLCADWVRAASTKEFPTFPTAPVPTEILVGVVLEGLPDDNRLLVEQLALVPRFDREAMRACTMLESRWDWLHELSFLYPLGEGWYTFPAAVREGVRQRWCERPRALEGEHAAWQRHWQARSKTDTDSFAALAWYSQWCQKPEVALTRWKELAARERSAGQTRAHDELLTWWEPTGLETRGATTSIEAEALSALGSELGLRATEDTPDRLLRAMQCFDSALSILTEKKSPRLWAGVKEQLGELYFRLRVGDRGANLTRAVACYEAALKVYIALQLPMDAARTRSCLGRSLQALPSGDRKENLTRAIANHQAALHLYTEQRFPQQWAGVQSDLGSAYAELPTGERDANLAHARECYQAAARVYTQDSHPIEWAVLQERVSVTQWLAGKHTEARQLLETALTVFREQGALVKVEEAQTTLQLWDPKPLPDDHRRKRRQSVILFLSLIVLLTVVLWGVVKFAMGQQRQ